MAGLGRSAGLHVAAALAGAGGMGLQAVFLARAGLDAGQSSAAAYGPAAYVIGWALGAASAGRGRANPARAALTGAAALAFGVALAVGLRAVVPPSLAPLMAWLALVCVAFPSGMLLPVAVRSHAAQRENTRLGSIYAANLLGALLGAWGIGFECVATGGRPLALGVASVASILAFVGASLASRGVTLRAQAKETGSRKVSAVAVVVAATTLWMLGLEWICARVAVMWIGSESTHLTLVVALSLLALALGAVVSRFVPKGHGVLAGWLVLCAAASLWPLFAAKTLAWALASGDVATTAVLVVPTLAPFGAVLPLLHANAPGEAGARLGNLLGYEVGGALLAGPLLHAWFVPQWGIAGTLGLLCGCAALSAIVLLVPRRQWKSVLASVAACSVLGVVAFRSPAPALASPKLVDPALQLLSFREDEHFSVAVVDDGVLGERTLLTDQFRAAGTGPDYRYMRALGALPVLLHPEPRRVAVLALGTGTTLGAVSLHDGIDSIHVLEISKAVVDASEWFRDVNRGAFDSDSLVSVRLDDGRRTLARSEGQYDVVTMEPLLPDSPFGVYLYTPEFYATAKRALQPGGILCQWIPPHALAPETFDALLYAFASSFEHADAWLFGTQVVLIGSERELSVDAARLEGLNPECRAALAELGLADVDGLASRHVGSLAGFPAPTRTLSDEDPWIAWRRKPRGLAVLEWLPQNLEKLEQLRSPLPWGGAKDAALASLREARIAQAWAEVELRRRTMTPEAARERALLNLETIPAAQRSDAEVRAFVDEVEFLFGLRSGIAALTGGDTRGALAALLRSAELRPERGDVHAYVALALWAGGNEPAARKAAERAVTTCPRIAETPAGQRCLSLGLPAELLRKR
jgi:spermidine synthase